MKILYLAHADNYHVKNWVRVLSNRGITVQCAGFRENKELIPEAIQYSGFSNELRWFDFLKVSKQIRSLVEEFKPDLIFASFAPTYGLSAILAKTNIPVVVQTWSRDIALPGSLVTFKDHLLVKTVGKWVLNKADGITTDGKECRNYLINRHPHLDPKTLATPWGIDLEFFSKSLVDNHDVRRKFSIPDNVKIIMSGRGLFWYYQPELVLKALSSTLKEHPNVFVLVLGLGHEMSTETKILMGNLQSHPRVLYFPSLVSKQQMRELWSITDFFISIPKFDGVSESVSEGRAMGAIPILNPLPSNLEQSTPNEHAYYTSTIDAKNLAEIIDSVLESDESTLAQIKVANTNWVHSFANVNHTVDSLISFFQTIINSYPRK